MKTVRQGYGYMVENKDAGVAAPMPELRRIDTVRRNDLNALLSVRERNERRKAGKKNFSEKTTKYYCECLEYGGSQ
jgi:hypothetical protein